MKKLLTLFAPVALAVAGAAQTHRVTLFQDSLINGTELKSGDYRVTVENGKAVISGGRAKVEAPVTVESADTKFSSTSVRYDNSGGKYRLKEIRIGGTATRLVFRN